MQTVTKHSSKTIEQYRHNIKLLKYHLRKQQKINETLRYKQFKHHKKQTANKLDKPQQKIIAYSMIYTVNQLNLRTKEMGLVLGDVFRMADYNYQGQITKEQFMNTILRLKSNIDQALINQMFYAIDTDLNGNLSSDQYAEFLYAHGGCDNKEAISFQKKSAQKFAAALKRKGIKIADFLSKTVDPCPVEELQVKLRELKLNVNQCMTLLKMWDPSLNGQIKHEVYLKSMQNVKQKDERQIQNQKFEKGVQELCIILRDRKINPIVIFEESEADGKPGISQFQLEEGLKKLLPEETPFQIRKWVNLINLNGDSEITREEFISSIKSFYSIQQISKFSSDYEKLHPQLKRALNEEDVPAEKIIDKLSIAIEDNGFTKTEVFHRIDINRNGLVDKQELLEGLKNLGINIGLIGKVLTVFDRDASGEVSLDQWLSILGEDVEMEELEAPAKGQNDKEGIKKEKTNNLKKEKANPNPKDIEKLKETSFHTKQQSKSKPTTRKESIKVQSNKTAIINKKTQPLKDHDKNKTLKSPQVKPSKQPKPKPSKKYQPTFAEDSMIQSKKDIKNQSDLEQEPNTEALEKQIAELYAKSKTSVLAKFKSIANNKKRLNQGQFSRCIDELHLSTRYKEEDIRSILEGNLGSNGMFEFQQWLNELPERYGIQVVEEKVKVATPRKPIITQRKSLQKSQVPSQDNNINYDESFENQSKIKQPAVKRGQDREDFQSLINLVIENQTHTEEGYKFSKFIANEHQLQLLNQKYLPLAEKIKSNKKIYKDNSFPTNISSLTDVSPASSKIDNVSLLKWKHYTQIFKNPQLFQKGIEPNDICQGQLGDCYFLCSLASLAQYKRLIERIFEYIDIENGYFLVWLCIDGIWKLIEVDGFIPVKPDGKAPVFSRCREGDEELWVILLEKAYAKAYGCYEHIVGGQPYEAIKDLTGAPGQSFSHKNQKIDPQSLWDKLNRANKSEFIMTCGTDESQKRDMKLDEHSQSVTAEGIVIGHAYSILDLTVYKGEKLIQLRNPWGTMEWKGAWSDKSAKWTPEARAALNYGEEKDKDDGIFWMPYDTFFKYYATTAINYIRPNYYYSSESKKSMKNLVIKIKAQSLRHGFVMVAQQDHRKKGIPSNSPYNVSHFIAINYKNGKILSKLADQKYMYQREGSVELDSESTEKNSQFIVMVNLEKPTNINLCTYADCQFEYEVDDSLDVMLEYIEAIASMEETQDPRKIQTDNSNNFKSWLTSVGQYAFLVFKNIGKKSITIEIDLKKPSNLELMGGLNSKLVIKPNETETIKGKIADLKQPYSFGPMSYGVS